MTMLLAKWRLCLTYCRLEVQGELVLPPVFKTGVGCVSVPGGFDSRALPPSTVA
jgi:hypothetical protein